jgi:hypothetical protein
MSNIYPLKAVITSNELLAAEYDQSAISAFMTSGALRPDAFVELVSQGARFDTVVTVNGERKDEIKGLLEKSNRTFFTRPKIIDVTIPSSLVLTEAVRNIQLAINPEIYGMTAAGG